MEAACADIVARAGRLAVWVNNAGVLHTGPAWEQDAATRDFMLDVNGRGVVNGTVAAIDAMRHTGGGHIVTTVSLAGITAVTGEAVYAASKHAVAQRFGGPRGQGRGKAHAEYSDRVQ